MSRDSVENNDFGWAFPDLNPRGAGQGGDLTQFAIRGDLETFVREVLQNSNDAADEDSDKPVEVVFKLHDLTGDDLEDFQDAFRWDEWKEQVDAAADRDNQIAQRTKRYADDVEDSGSLRTLVVEDRYTEGLTGSDSDDPNVGSTNFSALVRDSLESNKSTESAGGKFGLGKAVLRIFSGVSTVFFNSVLSEPRPRSDYPRLIGRSRLPQHYRGDTRHNGQGFYGDKRVQAGKEHVPPGSIWGDQAEELSEELVIDRPDNSTPGTSIMVVGFRDPDREEQPEIETLAEEIRDEAIKWFWPAIWQDQLRVSVETPEETFEANLDSVTAVRPFVQCLESNKQVNELEEEGDVKAENLSISIPDRVGDVKDPSMPDDGEVELSTRLTYQDGLDRTNHIAFIRGSGMVVTYWDRGKLVHGNRNFHSVALAGKARSWTNGSDLTEADDKVERFLKDAEPPTHDDWIQTDATREDYQQGTKKAIDKLKADIEENVSKWVGPNLDRGGIGPELLGNRFPISNDGSTEPTGGPSNITGNVHISRKAEDGCWEFEADVKAASSDDVITDLHLTLPRMGEDKQQNDYLSIQSIGELPSGWTSFDDGNGKRIKGSTGLREVRVSGKSVPDEANVETRFNVEATVEREESAAIEEEK